MINLPTSSRSTAATSKPVEVEANKQAQETAHRALSPEPTGGLSRMQRRQPSAPSTAPRSKLSLPNNVEHLTMGRSMGALSANSRALSRGTFLVLSKARQATSATELMTALAELETFADTAVRAEGYDVIARNLAGSLESVSEEQALEVRHALTTALEAVPVGPGSAAVLAKPLVSVFALTQAMTHRALNCDVDALSSRIMERLEPARLIPDGVSPEDHLNAYQEQLNNAYREQFERNEQVVNAAMPDLIKFNNLAAAHGMQSLQEPMGQMLAHCFDQHATPMGMQIACVMFPKRLAQLEKTPELQAYAAKTLTDLAEHLTSAAAADVIATDDYWGPRACTEIETAMQTQDIDPQAHPALKAALEKLKAASNSDAEAI